MAPFPFLLAILAFYLWNNWVWLLLIVVSAVASYWAQQMVHVRRRPRSGTATFRDLIEDIRDAPSPVDLELEDARYEGTGWRMLEVRKGWARVAVSCDLLLALNIGLVSVAVFGNPGPAAQSVRESTSDVSTYISIAVGILVFSFQAYAHKKATQPRRPKRAWLPAFLRTNT
jgi:hypothetical protein